MVQNATQKLQGVILVDHDTWLKREQKKGTILDLKRYSKGHDEKT